MRVFGNDFKKQGVTFCALIDECVGEKVSFSPGGAMFVQVQVTSEQFSMCDVDLCNLQRAFFYMVYLQ